MVKMRRGTYFFANMEVVHGGYFEGMIWEGQGFLEEGYFLICPD